MTFHNGRCFAECWHSSFSYNTSEWGLRLPSSTYKQTIYASIIEVVYTTCAVYVQVYLSHMIDLWRRFSENLPFLTTGYDEHHNTIKFGNNDIKSSISSHMLIYANTYVTLDHKTCLRSLGYICSNSQTYSLNIVQNYPFFFYAKNH